MQAAEVSRARFWACSSFLCESVMPLQTSPSFYGNFSRPGLQATGNWRDVIDDTSLNAVVVGTWPYLHKTLVLEALHAGKHVLTEARLVHMALSVSHLTCPGPALSFVMSMYDGPISHAWLRRTFLCMTCSCCVSQDQQQQDLEALSVQAMDASEAKEMYRASLRHPTLVTQVVPSPLTFEYDATIQDIVKKGVLGELLYIEVSHASAAQAMQAHM